MYIQKAKNMFYNKKFIMFIIIGCINSLSGIGFSWIYSNTLDKVTAFVAGYATGIIISYLLNSYFTFKEKLNVNKFVKFIISCMPNFAIQLIIVLIGVNFFHLNKLLVYAAAAIIGVPITFIILNIFVFIKK